MRMKNCMFIRIILLALVINAVVLAGICIPQDKVDKIDDIATKFMEYKKFNGTVLVAEKGKVIFKKGYGYADYEWKIPLTTDTKFRLGSITKQFTSMLVMQLVEKGEIDLEGKLSDYLPYYREDIGKQVTVHHLLTHTSGIPSYTGLPVFGEISRDPYSVKDFSLKFCSNDLEFEPGSTFKYNNSGYFLLGAILEEVTGKTYEDLLDEKIFDPLDMSDSGYDHHETLLTKRAKGYEISGMEIENASYLDMSLPYAAGSLYSTVEDLYKWDQALYDEKLLSNEYKEIMLTPFLENYAYGWAVGDTICGEIAMGHGGGINGFNTLITRVPEDKHLVVVLNSQPGANLNQMTNSIISVLYDEDYSLPKRGISDLLYNEIRKKDVGAGIKKVRKIKEDSPDDYSFTRYEFVIVALQLSKVKKYDDAFEVLNYSLEVYPDSFYLYYILGVVYSDSGDNDNAIKYYSKALGENPKFTPAISRLQELIKK
ncbi:MAG: serine hydrolase [bacterium]|nr:serine hydrolase [bacterium]